MKLKVGDKVIVTAGSNKGKVGKLNKVFSKNNKVIVEGINLIKKHKKPGGKDQTGGILEYEAPIHISNVMLVDSKTGKGTRKRIEETKVTEKKTSIKKETKVAEKKAPVKKEETKVKAQKEKKVSTKTNKKNDK